MDEIFLKIIVPFFIFLIGLLSSSVFFMWKIDDRINRKVDEKMIPLLQAIREMKEDNIEYKTWIKSLQDTSNRTCISIAKIEVTLSSLADNVTRIINGGVKHE